VQLAFKVFVESRVIFISMAVILVLITSRVQNLLFMLPLFVPFM
jgi:hypothetical protein